MRTYNRNILIGFMIILGIFLYNMAAVNNDGGVKAMDANTVQAIGSTIQAIAAVVTLFLMWRLGKHQNDLAEQQTRLTEEQKEMTRRQINLALYENRYKIYIKCMVFLNEVGYKNTKMIDYYILGKTVIPDKEKEAYKTSIHQETILFQENIQQKSFLFDNDVQQYIDSIIDMVTILIQLIDDSKKEELQDQISLIRKEMLNVQDHFKPYIDFRKI